LQPNHPESGRLLGSSYSFFGSCESVRVIAHDTNGWSPLQARSEHRKFRPTVRHDMKGSKSVYKFRLETQSSDQEITARHPPDGFSNRQIASGFRRHIAF
jgi:hypothetical protein